VEGSHSKLGARLTDGLGCDDTNRFSLTDGSTVGKVQAVATRAHTSSRFAGQDGAYAHALDPCVINGFSLGKRQNISLVGKHNAFVSWKTDIITHSSAKYPVTQAKEFLIALLNALNLNTVQRTAIVLCNDDVLCNVDETTSEVARVSCFKSCVSKPLASTVS
jgi:hypothetical protein